MLQSRVGMFRGCRKVVKSFVFFISLLIVAQHVSGNHVPIIKELTTA